MIGPGVYAHIDFTRRLTERMEQLAGGTVCELGGGARPAVEQEFLQKNGLECLIVDISESELRKAPPGYRMLVADVSSPSFAAGEHTGAYDLVFSRVLAEHVRGARQFHQNVHKLLRPGGTAMHFFPTLWWPPFVANRVLPEALARRILLKFAPYREESGVYGKFPAYYEWCYGPTPAQVRRFESVGFTVEHCVAYFGEQSHAPGALLKKADLAWTDLMLRHPSYRMTTYAAYTLRAR